MDDTLSYFQARLLDLLASELSEAEVLEQLKADPELAEFEEYISSWEPRMVNLAQHLTKKWGVKDEIGKG